MSQGVIIAGVAMVAICCSVSSAAYVMMGGEEKKTTTPTGPGPAGPGPAGPAPSPPAFVIHETGDRAAGDLVLTPDQTLDQCKALCKANADCIGISYNSVDKSCYQKGTTGGGQPGEGTGPLQTAYGTPSPHQFYYKNVPGYEVKGAGDRPGGDIEGMPVTKETLKECADVCGSKTNCVGFSYDSYNNTCYAKKADGLVADYVNNGYQFYTKK